MRINVYTEEMNPSEQPQAEIVTAEYVSSRTGEKMKNYGLRVYLKSHPDLHFIPGRDDDRSAITFWCGSKERNVFEFIEGVKASLGWSSLTTWREKTEEQQRKAEALIPAAGSTSQKETMRWPR